MQTIKLAAEEAVKSVKDGFTIGIGTSDYAIDVIKALKEKILHEDIKVAVCPPSLRIANLLSEFKIDAAALEDTPLDLTIEFAARADKEFNFIKTDTDSLIRDKMLALSSNKNIIIVDSAEPVEILNGVTPFEVSAFAVKSTLRALQELGRNTTIRKERGKTFITEESNIIIDVDINPDLDIFEIDEISRKIPGVLETGIFEDIATKAIFLGPRTKQKL